MLNLPTAEDASDISYSYRTKRLQKVVNEAMHDGKQCAYLKEHLTNRQDVYELHELGYETNVDSRGELWIHWRKLND